MQNKRANDRTRYEVARREPDHRAVGLGPATPVQTDVERAARDQYDSDEDG